MKSVTQYFAFFTFVTVLMLPTLAGPQPATTITVVNNGQEAIVELYVAGRTAQSWGADILRGSPIPPHGERNVTSPEVCPCKVRAIYDDGELRYQNANGSGVVITFVH